MEIRPILTALLHDTPVLTLAHHNSIMTKMPSEISNTCWHQDRRYWDFQNDDLLSIWLALGEERLENGLLEFIPGSHRITSYNVCYTKLLRCLVVLCVVQGTAVKQYNISRMQIKMDPFGKNGTVLVKIVSETDFCIVITSYSIHYTKLYECL